MWRLALAALAVTGLLLAVEAPGEKEKVKQTKTERMDFPSGGVLRLSGLSGDLTIEGWDQPGTEITTTKTTKEEYDAATRQKGVAELDQVQIASEHHANEIVVLISDIKIAGTIQCHKKRIIEDGIRGGAAVAESI